MSSRHNRKVDNMDYAQIAREGVIYDVGKFLLLSFLSTAGITFLANKVFKVLEGFKDIFYFSSVVFVMLFGFLYIVTPRTQMPVLAGGIETVVSGSPPNDQKLTLVVITMSVMNSGSMQTIVKGWSIEAKIAGRPYYGSFLAQPPKDFTFKSQNNGLNLPTAIVYHSEDNLLVKALTPVQPGGLTNGLLYVVFSEIDPGLFKGGVDYTVKFQDVLGKEYEAHIATSAIVASLATTPGLHSELICPIPPNAGAAIPNATPAPAVPPIVSPFVPH